MPHAVVRFVIAGPDLDVLRRFYLEAFGWTSFDIVPDYAALETFPHDHDERGNDITPPYVLEARGGALYWRHEGEAHRPRPIAAGPEGGLLRDPPGVFLCIEVPDVVASLAAVELAGGSIIQSPHFIPGFTVVARFADPAGNVLELQQQLPAFTVPL